MSELTDQLAIDRYNELLASHERLRVALESCLDAIGEWEGDDDPYYVTQAREALKQIPKGE